MTSLDALLQAPIPDNADQVYTVDARGLFCPMPIVRLGQEIRKQPAQTLFLLEATDPGTAPDLLKWAPPWGHTVLAIRHATQPSQEEIWQFWVQRGQ